MRKLRFSVKVLVVVFASIVVATFLAVKVSGAATVQTKSPVKQYTLANVHKKCKVDYRKETVKVRTRERITLDGKATIKIVEKREVACVYIPPPVVEPAVVATPAVTPLPAPTVTTNLAVHLDPTFVQSASNPLSVVYTASAAASQTVGQVMSQDVSLPQGVLDFYSDGNLACSTNVGNNVTTTNCSVTYTTLGAHTVVTEYISGTNSATETDTEQISGQTTTTTVVLTGDPAQGATTSTLTATVTSALGTDTSPVAGAVTFIADGAILHTSQSDQTSCTLDWTGPTFSRASDAYLASATSPDCSVTGTPVTNVTSFSYSASFMGATGLTASASQVGNIADWPQTPMPVTNYITGDPYDIAIGTTTIGSCTVAGLMSIQFCLNAPALTLTDATDAQQIGSSDNYSWMTTTLTDVNGSSYTPATGEPCGVFESAHDQCPLGDDNSFGMVPNPLISTFVVTPPNGAVIEGAPVVTWIGSQETTTIMTHALVGSESVQNLSS